jgi:hypothetical protein
VKKLRKTRGRELLNDQEELMSFGVEETKVDIFLEYRQ